MRTGSFQLVLIGLAPLALGSCSYSYDLVAIVIGGQLAFTVDPDSKERPKCIHRAEVRAQADSKTLWLERSGDYCPSSFPFFYGSTFGSRPENAGKIADASPRKTSIRNQGTTPERLQIGVNYEVSTTTDPNGYGRGLFRIRQDRTIENWPRDAL